MFRLEGKVAVVTGGASGIGKGIAAALLAAGAQVHIFDIQKLPDEDEIHTEERLVSWSSIDVTSSSGVKETLSRVKEMSGGIDILVNSAGILSDCGIEDITDEAWDKMIRINLTGTFYCCREAVKIMDRSSGGVILNIASAGGKQGYPMAGPHYSASKAAIMALTRQIALQKGAAGIRANALSPGPVETPLLKNRSEEIREFMLRQIPIRRFSHSEDIAAAALFLVSEESSFITGQNVDINGGLYMD